MELNSKQIYDSLIRGAYNVIMNKETLNRINVFPVQDGDTGSNLSSMMRTIILKSEQKKTVKETLESVAEASIYGARGNSGIIFAQYFRGLSETIDEGEFISIDEYAKASSIAAQYAYNAVERPVEGTMITLMREWGSFLLCESSGMGTIEDIFTNAFQKLQIALEKTKEQLAALKKANVVDSGAMGFTCFIEGIIHHIKNQEEISFNRLYEQNEYMAEPATDEPAYEMPHESYAGFRYCSECLLEDSNRKISICDIKNELQKAGDSVVVAGNENKCRVHIHTNNPAALFKYLYDKGEIIYQKVDDMYRQEAVVNHRKYDIALVTDSIADIPQELIDEYQIQMINLEILYKNMVYMDKLTINPSELLKMSCDENELPTSSQPNPKNIENLLDYLSTYYSSVIIMTVSKELSGTYNNFVNVSREFSKDNFKISVINTMQNSGAQGLLVKKCAEYIDAGLGHDEIVELIRERTGRSKILVQVRSLDNMIKSGRLSVKAGALAKKAGMKPVVTLDINGKGALESVAFSIKGSNKKIINHIRKKLKTSCIEQYNIVHVNNPDAAIELADIMTDIIGFKPAYIMETSSIVAVGAGDGAVALSYILE